MPLASEVTGEELVAAARRRADMAESDFRSEADWYRYVSAGWAKVYRRVIAAGGDRFLDSRIIATAPGVGAYDLPFDFFIAKGFDLVVGGTTRTIDMFQWDKRNMYRALGEWGLTQPVSYRLRGNRVAFLPVPTAVYQVTIWFWPAPDKLTAETSVDGLGGLEEAIIVSAARMAATEQGDFELAATLAAQEQVELQRVDEEAPGRDAGGIECAVDRFDRANEWWPIRRDLP